VSLTPVANVVDTNYSAVTKVSKTLVPGLRPLDGLHADLRTRATSLT